MKFFSFVLRNKRKKLPMVILSKNRQQNYKFPLRVANKMITSGPALKTKNNAVN